MGQVPGELVAAAFGVFNPEVVVPRSPSAGRSPTRRRSPPPALDGAVGQLERILGAGPDGLDRANELLARAVAPLEPRGRPLYAGQLLAAARHAAGRPVRLGDRCASTGATATSRRGSPPGSTPPRSACSPSSTGACRCAPTSAPGRGATPSSTPPRRGSPRPGHRGRHAHRGRAARPRGVESRPTPRWLPPSTRWVTTSPSSRPCWSPGPERSWNAGGYPASPLAVSPSSSS